MGRQITLHVLKTISRATCLIEFECFYLIAPCYRFHCGSLKVTDISAFLRQVNSFVVGVLMFHNEFHNVS